MAKRRRNRRSAMLQICVDPEARDLPVPRVHHKGDVGFDLFVARDTIIPPGTHLPPTDIPTGISIKVPRKTWATIVSRSSAHLLYPTLRLCSAPIDEGYTGPLAVRVQNTGKKAVVVKRGMRLAQLVIFPAVVPKVIVVNKLPKTARGSARYGSTGK